METMQQLTQEQADRWVGDTARTIMMARRLTTQDIADRMGLTYQTMRNKLAGDRSWHVNELISLGSALDVTVEELCNGWNGLVKVPDPRPADFRKAHRVAGGRRKPSHVQTLWAGSVEADAPIAQLAELRTFNPRVASRADQDLQLLRSLAPSLWTVSAVPR